MEQFSDYRHNIYNSWAHLTGILKISHGSHPIYNQVHKDISYEYLLSSNPYEYSVWSVGFYAAFKLRAHEYAVCLHQLWSISLFSCER